MREIPKIFPLGLLALVIFIVFVAAYALAESAIGGVPVAQAAEGVTEGARHETAFGDDAKFGWYEDAAFFICPLH
jgi:hypothetical protein